MKRALREEAEREGEGYPGQAITGETKCGES